MTPSGPSSPGRGTVSTVRRSDGTDAARRTVEREGIGEVGGRLCGADRGAGAHRAHRHRVVARRVQARRLEPVAALGRRHAGGADRAQPQVVVRARQVDRGEVGEVGQHEVDGGLEPGRGVERHAHEVAEPGEEVEAGPGAAGFAGQVDALEHLGEAVREVGREPDVLLPVAPAGRGGVREDGDAHRRRAGLCPQGHDDHGAGTVTVGERLLLGVERDERAALLTRHVGDPRGAVAEPCEHAIDVEGPARRGLAEPAPDLGLDVGRGEPAGDARPAPDVDHTEVREVGDRHRRGLFEGQLLGLQADDELRRRRR